MNNFWQIDPCTEQRSIEIVKSLNSFGIVEIQIKIHQCTRPHNPTQLQLQHANRTKQKFYFIIGNRNLVLLIELIAIAIAQYATKQSTNSICLQFYLIVSRSNQERSG